MQALTKLGLRLLNLISILTSIPNQFRPHFSKLPLSGFPNSLFRLENLLLGQAFVNHCPFPQNISLVGSQENTQ